MHCRPSVLKRDYPAKRVKIEGASVMGACIWRPLKLLLFIVAGCSGLLAILAAWTAIPEAGRNPASTDFAWIRNDWLLAFVLANAIVLPTIAVASDRVRTLFALFLLLIWGASIVPGYQYCLYQLQ